MRTSVRSWMLALVVSGLLTGINAAAQTVNDTGFLQCFYECKLFPPAAPSFYQEQTTLMLMNGEQPTALPPHPVTRTANLAFLNGNGRILGKTKIELTPHDLDELNVCYTIVQNLAAAPPAAGLILVAVVDSATGGPGRDVDVMVKNPVGRMSLDDPEVFNGRIAGVGKTPCPEIYANPVALLDYPGFQQAPDWQPFLIEGTDDVEPAGR